MSISARIRRARKERGLSQAQLAELMKVTRSACSQWELEGGTAPRGHRLERLAAILKVTVEWLATGEGAGPGMGTADSIPAYKNALTDDERELIAGYARLGREGKTALLQLLRSLSSRKR